MPDGTRRARTLGGHNAHPGAGAAKQLQHRCPTCSSGRGHGVALEWKAPLDAHIFHLAAKTLGHPQQGAVGTGAAPGRAQVL